MPAEELSEGALALLRLHFSGRSLIMGAAIPTRCRVTLWKKPGPPTANWWLRG